MSRPTVAAATERLYAALGPALTGPDEDLGWPLLRWLDGIGHLAEPVEQLVSDNDDGPGWSQLYDVDRVPSAWLPHLAMHVGVTLPDGVTDAAKRQMIRDAAGFTRGTVPALRAAVQRHLKPGGVVDVDERTESPYHLTVRVWQGQLGGLTYGELSAAHPTYEDLTAAYETYADMGAAGTLAERAAQRAKAVGLVLTFEIVPGLPEES